MSLLMDCVNLSNAVSFIVYFTFCVCMQKEDRIMKNK